MVVVVVVTVVCWALTVEATPSNGGTATAVIIRIRSCLRPGSRGSSAPLSWRDQTSILRDWTPSRVEEIAAGACKLRNTNELTRLSDLRLLDYDLDAPVLWLRHTITGRHQRSASPLASVLIASGTILSEARVVLIASARRRDTRML